MLPVYNAGQLIGEFVAIQGIHLFRRESIALEVSLSIYFVVGQLLGNGAIGRFSGPSWERLALRPMGVTLLGGIANGSADNCISTFLFAAVEQGDRPTAEAFSSLTSNIVGPIALAVASLRYKALLENDIVCRYDNGSEIAQKVLKDIGAVDTLSNDQRKVILQYAREGIERNIREVDFGLLLGIVAVLGLCWKDVARWLSRRAAGG